MNTEQKVCPLVVMDECATSIEQEWGIERSKLREARAKVAELVAAANMAKRALLTGQPEIRGDDTVYPLDGALVGNALNSLRAALAAFSEVRS